MYTSAYRVFKEKKSLNVKYKCCIRLSWKGLLKHQEGPINSEGAQTGSPEKRSYVKWAFKDEWEFHRHKGTGMEGRGVGIQGEGRRGEESKGGGV